MWYPNEGAREFQGGGNDEPYQMLHREASGELRGDPVELKVRPPRKGCHSAVLMFLNLKKGLKDPGTLGQGSRGNAGWCWCL